MDPVMFDDDTRERLIRVSHATGLSDIQLIQRAVAGFVKRAELDIPNARILFVLPEYDAGESSH
jgi:hypothetical protein